MDSRALDHMTCSVSLHQDVHECKNTPLISLPTRDTLKLFHVGNVKLSNEITLKNILYILASKHNLLSFDKLCEEMNYKVVFFFISFASFVIVRTMR